MCFHHSLLVLMGEELTPAAIAAQSCGSHVEGREFALDVQFDFTPVKLHPLAGDILLLDEAVLDRCELVGLLAFDVPDYRPVRDRVTGPAKVSMDISSPFLLLLHTHGHLGGVINEFLVNQGLDFIRQDWAVHLPVFVLGLGSEKLSIGFWIVLVIHGSVVQLTEPNYRCSADAAFPGYLAVA